MPTVFSMRDVENANRFSVKKSVDFLYQISYNSVTVWAGDDSRWQSTSVTRHLLSRGNARYTVTTMYTLKYKLQQPQQLRRLRSDLDIPCHVHNHFVALIRRHYQMYGQHEGYKHPSRNRLCKHLTKLKRLPKYARWRQPFSWTLQDCLDRIHKAYQRFFKKLAKRPSRFKKRYQMQSMTFSSGQCKIESHKKKKPGGCPVAKIRLNGRWYKFWRSRPIVGEVQRVTVKQDKVGDWFISILTDAEYTEDMPKTGKAAGHDFGLKTFLTSSDGNRAQAPEFFRRSLNAIARAHRRFSRSEVGSNHRHQRRIELARVYRKISRQREDYFWKLARYLVETFDWNFFEDLNIAAMKRLWGRKVSDLAFSKFLSIVQQVARKCSKNVALIDRWYPSTKTCHCCGSINYAITLRDRTWTCPRCHVTHERDMNAAINIVKVGASTHELGSVRQAIACNCCCS